MGRTGWEKSTACVQASLVRHLWIFFFDGQEVYTVTQQIISFREWQGASRAGKRLGLGDVRAALLSHCFRLLDETQSKLSCVVV